MADEWTLHDETGAVRVMPDGTQALEVLVGNAAEGTNVWLIGGAPMLTEKQFKITITEETGA